MGYVKRGDLERKKEKHVEKDKETGEETVSYTYWEYPVWKFLTWSLSEEFLKAISTKLNQ